MRDDDAWTTTQDGLSAATAKVERAAAAMTAVAEQLKEFLRGPLDRPSTELVLAGLGLGLAFHGASSWTKDAPLRVAEVRAAIAALDADVERGELPATAHSWKHGLAERLTFLDARVTSLRDEFESIEAELKALTGNFDSAV